MTPTHPLRLAMLGMVPGNGHPYSWSAIVNGYDPVEMAKCPYSVIPVYLGAQPLESVRIPGARVTHIWTDDPADAPKVARASKIPHIVERMEEVIGHVDGVVIATDDGTDHVRRARPFIEAGLPIFIDKPLATTHEELAQFVAWKKAGARILSSSGKRYSPEYQSLIQKPGTPWRWITSTTLKNWEAYGIHALEPVYRITGPGFAEVRCETHGDFTSAHLRHHCGTVVTIAIVPDSLGSFGVIHAYGREENRTVHLRDTYAAFRGQMLAMIDWFRTGIDPYPFDETVEMMAILIAGLESRATGQPVAIEPLFNSFKTTTHP